MLHKNTLLCAALSAAILSGA
ncbi:hypothetical protein, partial [Cronobacter sakazakii]